VVGEWKGKDWVILSGLQSGDKVIIDNLIKVRPGMPVTNMSSLKK
jgi:membrane fusion protein (multidrug efflux system)